MSVNGENCSALPMSAVLPGLVLVSGIEILVHTRLLPGTAGLKLLLNAILVVLPWVTLWFFRCGVDALGYTRDRVILYLGWGFVAGGFWRIASVAINLWGLTLNGLVQDSTQVLLILIWVPFIEETFFRGYVGRTLSQELSPGAGILAQAVLFTLLPTHTIQGAWSLFSIFGFGVLAGWLMSVRKSIWPPLGAHAFANLLPLLVLALD